jgi:hypothetical protein
MNIREIDEATYLDMAQNGARVLFDYEDYRVLDGIKDEDESYFIIDFKNNKWYEIDLKTCYDLFTVFLFGDKGYLLEQLDSIKDGGYNGSNGASE